LATSCTDANDAVRLAGDSAGQHGHLPARPEIAIALYLACFVSD
jgi:hypothetical protein